MTTPLISITLPTFCSGMPLLESRNQAPSEETPAKRGQFIEAPFVPVLVGDGPALLLDHRHPGGVIEASDVRADEGGNRHSLTVSAASARVTRPCPRDSPLAMAGGDRSGSAALVATWAWGR